MQLLSCYSRVHVSSLSPPCSQHTPRLFIAASFTNAWVGIAFLRAGASLPRCRVFCLFFGLSMAIGAISWYIPSLRETAVPAIVAPLSACLFASFVPHEHDVPINIEYHAAKFTGVKMLLLGQPVIALAISPPRAVGGRIYTFAALSLTLVVAIKLLILSCDVVPVKNHAIRQSRRAALLWLHGSQPALALAIISVAAGVGAVMEALSQQGIGVGDAHVKGPARLLNLSVAGLFVTLAITQALHKSTYSSAAILLMLLQGVFLAGWGLWSSGLEYSVVVSCASCLFLLVVLQVCKLNDQAISEDETKEASEMGKHAKKL